MTPDSDARDARLMKYIYLVGAYPGDKVNQPGTNRLYSIDFI